MALERSSGLLLHISSLPSYGGIGDFGPAAYAFADFLAAAKQRLVASSSAEPNRLWQFTLRRPFRLRRQSVAD